MFAPAVGAGLLMAFSRTLWSYATVTEVYTLNALIEISAAYKRRRLVKNFKPSVL